MASKRAVANTYHNSQSNHRHDIFLNHSSSSSITEVEEGEEDDDSEVKMLDETIQDNGFDQSNKYLNALTISQRHSKMNQQKTKTDIGGTMIQELLQSNLDLKYKDK